MTKQDLIKAYRNTAQFRAFDVANAVFYYLEEALENAEVVKENARDAAAKTPEYMALMEAQDD